MNKFDALILAGGFGTRMSKKFPGVPKPLIPIASIPVLEHILMECKEHEINNILISVFHRKEQIIEYVGDGSKFDLNIDYVVEHSPIGTGGALFLAQERLADNFLVLYADVYSKLNLKKLRHFHLKHSSDVTSVVHPNDHPYDSDLVECDDENNIINLLPKDDIRPEFYKNCAAAAMYYLSKNVFQLKVNNSKFDIASDLVPICIDKKFKVKAYHTIEYIKDMGTPERFNNVCSAVKNHIHTSRSRKQKRAAVIIDRDGTINVENGHISSLEKLDLVDGASEAIRTINQSKFLALCATNQPILARGDVTALGLLKIHNKLDTLLGLNGAYLDDLSFCPHHPETGFAGEIADLKIECNCRKPKSGLIDYYVEKYNLDKQKSIMVGDRFSDVKAAYGGGINSILLSSGAYDKQNHLACRPTRLATSLLDATRWILRDFQKLFQIAKRIFLQHSNSNQVLLLFGESEDNCRSVARILQQHFITSSVIFDLNGELRLDHHRINSVTEKLFSFLSDVLSHKHVNYSEIITFSDCSEIWVAPSVNVNNRSTLIVPVGQTKFLMDNNNMYETHLVQI